MSQIQAEPGEPYKCVVTEMKQDNGLGGQRVFEYAYHGRGYLGTRKEGFVGFWGRRIHDVSRGTYTYVQDRLSPLMYGRLNARYVFDGVFGQSETQLISKLENRLGVTGLTRGDVSSAFVHPTHSASFNYEDGQLVSVVNTKISYAFAEGLVDQQTIVTEEARRGC